MMMKRLLATAGAATLAVLLTANAAHADTWIHITTYKNVARGTCSIRVSPGYYDYVTVQDNWADGVGVYGRFKLNNGQIHDVSDPDGSKSRIGTKDFTSTPYFVVAYECVARNLSTTGWVSTGA